MATIANGNTWFPGWILLQTFVAFTFLKHIQYIYYQKGPSNPNFFIFSTDGFGPFFKCLYACRSPERCLRRVNAGVGSLERGGIKFQSSLLSLKLDFYALDNLAYGAQNSRHHLATKQLL